MQKQDVPLANTWKGLNRLVNPSLLDETESPDTVDTAPDNQVLGLLGPRRGMTKVFNRSYTIMGLAVFNLPWGRFRSVATNNGTWEAISTPWPTFITPTPVPTIINNQDFINNYIANDSFNLDTRGGGVIADAALGPDYWRMGRETADFSYAKTTGVGSGFNCRNFCRFTKITNAGKIMVTQAINGLHTAGLLGKNVQFGFTIRSSAARNMRFMWIKNTGTEDVVSPLVAAWGGASVDPTLNAGFTSMGVATFAVTTGITNWVYTLAALPTCANLILAIFSDTQFAANAYIDLCRTYLVVDTDTTAKTWEPMQSGLELARQTYEPEV
jgi:hypothetical protein